MSGWTFGPRFLRDLWIAVVLGVALAGVAVVAVGGWCLFG